jgi:hypothetical protein
MEKIADLELGLQFQAASSYAVDFRFHLPDSETDVRTVKTSAQIDPAALLPFLPGSAEYGRALTADVFGDAELRARFAEALALCREQNLSLRLRLAIDPRALTLHDLAWETLENPEDGTPLSTNPNILFSRYLSSQDWRPVSLRHQERMNALALIANPANLADYSLSALDVPGEVERVKSALGGIPFSLLGSEASGDPATPEALFEQLRQRKPDGSSYYDILLLVCHGSLRQGQPWLWLEDQNGGVRQISGAELVTRTKELSDLPMLVVLASCESAGSEAGRALSALGPQLSLAGVPAVVAMQGQISQETSGAFTQAFFRALQQEGIVDLAASLGRGQVRARPDAWMPALYMRLRSGRIWYLPGFSSSGSDLKIWESLRTSVEEEVCTLIIGPELSSSLLGDGRDLALEWSDLHGFPLSQEDRDKLSRVAQYISVNQSSSYLRSAYQKAIRTNLLQRFSSTLSADLAGQERWKPDDLLLAINQAAQSHWPDPGENPYNLLAKMGLSLYITSEQGDLLKQALMQAGRQPQVRLCPWNNSIRTKRTIWYYNDDPSPEQPLIYHLFGHFSEPASLVFTEDDIYDYLINLTEHRDLIPDSVIAALADSALFFLGFQLDDWQFRVFFRLIMNQPGVEGLDQYSHVAAQIAPREGLIEDADRARQYLQRYLERKHIDLFWGSSQDFLRLMVKRLKLKAAAVG